MGFLNLQVGTLREGVFKSSSFLRSSTGAFLVLPTTEQRKLQCLLPRCREEYQIWEGYDTEVGFFLSLFHIFITLATFTTRRPTPSSIYFHPTHSFQPDRRFTTSWNPLFLDSDNNSFFPPETTYTCTTHFGGIERRATERDPISRVSPWILLEWNL